MHPYRAWPFLSDPHHATLSAGWAVVMHGLLSVLVVLPLLRESDRPIAYGLLAAAGGVAVDLDHVAVAGSISPSALEHLARRPDTHSLLAAVALAAFAWALWRSVTVGWCVFAVLIAHLLPDAAGGGERWLYPVRSVESIPWLACPLGLILLICASSLIARHRRSQRAVFLPGPGQLPAIASESPSLRARLRPWR